MPLLGFVKPTEEVCKFVGRPLECDDPSDADDSLLLFLITGAGTPLGMRVGVSTAGWLGVEVLGVSDNGREVGVRAGRRVDEESS